MSYINYLKEKRKEESDIKKKRIEKYWKLSPIERIDYDNKIKSIKERYNFNLFTLSIIKVSFWLMVFFCVFNYFFNYFFNNLIDISLILSQQSIILFIFQNLWIFIIIDIMLLLICPKYRTEDIKELNKRFKL